MKCKTTIGEIRIEISVLFRKIDVEISRYIDEICTEISIFLCF